MRINVYFSSYQVLQLSRLFFMKVQFTEGGRTVFVNPQTHFGRSFSLCLSEIGVDRNVSHCCCFSPAKCLLDTLCRNFLLSYGELEETDV